MRVVAWLAAPRASLDLDGEPVTNGSFGADSG
jgi:hypothetical protein